MQELSDGVMQEAAKHAIEEIVPPDASTVKNWGVTDDKPAVISYPEDSTSTAEVDGDTGDLTAEETAATEQIGEKLADSVVGIIDEDLLKSREELHKKFDAAFRIVFGENYRALGSATKSFEYGTKSFYVSLGYAVGRDDK